MPFVIVEMKLADRRGMQITWTNSVEPPLPRPLQARQVRFKLRAGVLFHFEPLEITGLAALSEKKARQSFVETGVLLKLKSSRIYTPERLNRGLAALKEQLQRLGYQDAVVTASRLEQDNRSGRVHVGITVSEGPKSMVRTVRVETFTENQPVVVRMVQTNHPFSTLWQQDFTQDLKATNYHRGYPDTTVAMTNQNRSPASNNVVNLDLAAEVRTGPQARVGKIIFEGEKRTQVSTLRSRVP